MYLIVVLRFVSSFLGFPAHLTPRSVHTQYVSLNTKAMQLVKHGGILMTCSCSGAMTQSKGFLSVISAAARRAGVHATLVSKAGAGADHAIDPRYPEGEYLSNYMVRITR